MPKIIFQPLMIANPPKQKRKPVGVPADLKSADKKRLDLFLCGYEIRLKRGCVSPAGPFSGLQIRNSYPYGGGLQIRRNREREKTRARKPGHFCRLRLPACCPSPIPRASAGEARHLQPSARFCPTWNPSPHWYPHISSALQAD